MNELFSVYGFGLELPDDWRVEFNPKNTRLKGDVAFHSQKNNVFFVSWGRLEEARKRFKGLGEHRDATVKRIRENPNILKAEVVASSDQTVAGHGAVYSEMVAQRRRAFMGPQQKPQQVLSLHFYCPEADRYYVVYWHLSDPEEYPDGKRMFEDIAKSVSCHRQRG